jgi:hypothetical protein
MPTIALFRASWSHPITSLTRRLLLRVVVASLYPLPSLLILQIHLAPCRGMPTIDLSDISCSWYMCLGWSTRACLYVLLYFRGRTTHSGLHSFISGCQLAAAVLPIQEYMTGGWGVVCVLGCFSPRVFFSGLFSVCAARCARTPVDLRSYFLASLVCREEWRILRS